METKKATVIAIAGKGGVGKTTTSALIIRYLLKHGLTPVFAVDADSNVNLNLALGVDIEETIGQMREDVISNIDNIPAGMSKDAFVEYRMEHTLTEAEGFDLIAMGRPEGPGCYCYANSLLRRYLDQMAKNYNYVVIDNEAGMEHLSRRTTQSIDILFMVTDPAPTGIITAGRIRDLTEELKLDVKETRLIISRAPGDIPEQLQSLIADNSLKLAGVLPNDEILVNYSLQGRSLLELPDDVPAVKALDKIMNEALKG